YNAYQIFLESGGTGADGFLMDGLAGQVPTPTLLLLLAGIIMVITLYTSKKAKSVVKTSLDLGRQDEGYERFGSYMLSRSIVRRFATMANFVNDRLPETWRQSTNRQFDQTPFTRRQVHKGKGAPAFDMIRASVTLIVASSLIAIGTNLKLPLSTTYVTFMVFMGTSLADGAWGRESAVYRVSGVLSVIGGWFFTAFSAFVVAFIMALIFHFGGIVGIVVMIAISGYIIYRTHIFHNKKDADAEVVEKSIEEGTLTKAKVISLCSTQLKSFLKQYGDLTDKSFSALGEENLTALNQIYQAYKPIYSKIKSLKNSSSSALDQVPDHELESGHLYILVVDYLADMGKQVNVILKENLDHVDNNHKPLLPEQIEELKSLHAILFEWYEIIIDIFKHVDTERPQEIYNALAPFMRETRAIRKKQIKRIKNHEVGTRNSVLFLNQLGELRNLALFSTRIVRVFDELILNPVEESDFHPSAIKKELKEMRKEAKSVTADILLEDDNGEESPQEDQLDVTPNEVQNKTDVDPNKPEISEGDGVDSKDN
ncbi:MAG: hypothetical protein HKN76_07685, partial [Saprospiraceae bacterium]|nr:hypothetical protein [Saprospiraceae bacterium]